MDNYEEHINMKIVWPLMFAGALLIGEGYSFAKDSKGIEESLMIELTGKKLTQKSEEQSYTEIVNAYQFNQLKKLEPLIQEYQQMYKNSFRIDDVHYLLGKAYLENRFYSKALFQFNFVIKNYPTSNKVISSRYAKAKTFMKMNLAELAQQELSLIKSKYPGSPEFYRASSDLKNMSKSN